MQGGGVVEEWPALVPLGSGESVTPVEVLLTDQRVAELSHLGLMPLAALRGTTTAVFFDNPSCARPTIDDSPEASALAAASVQLPYILTISRFIHYFRAIACDRFGRTATSPEDIAAELNSWVQRHVSPRGASAEWRTRYLPIDVRVEVVPDPGRPRSQRALVRLRLRDDSAGSPSSLEEVVDLTEWALLRPYYLLGNLAVSLRSVIDLPPKGPDQPPGPARVEPRGRPGRLRFLREMLARLRSLCGRLTYEVERGAKDSPVTRVSLLDRVRDPGDRRDWEELVNCYGPMIRAWCRSEFPGEEEDIVQEVFLRFVSILPTLPKDVDEDHLRRLLETITHRVMVDQNRRRRALPRARDAQERLDSLEERQDATAPAPRAEEFDLDLLRRAKERVRARVSSATWSAYVETAERGRKLAEVARELGCTVNAVYVAKHRVIAQLRREVEHLGGLGERAETVRVRPKKPGAAIGRRPKRTPRAKSDHPPAGRESAQEKTRGAPVQEALPEAAEASTLRRHTDISFPARVRVRQWTCLRIQLVPAEVVLPGGEVREQSKPHPHDTTLALLAPPQGPEAPPPPVRLTVSIVAENFEIRGPYRAEILVPRDGPSPAVHFDLCGQAVGQARIMIDFAQEGRPVGSVDLRPEVVPEVILETSGGDRGVDPVLLDIGGDREPAPDLVLKVFEHQLAGRPGRLHFVLSSSHPALVDLPVFDGDLGTLDLRADVAAWVEAQFQALRHLAERPDATADEVTRVLSDVGWKLYDQILPPALQDLCWTFRGRGVRSLLILSDDPHIPWELVKPFRSDPVTGAIVAEEDHWGASFAMTHWLRGRPPVSRLSLRRVIAVGTGTSKPRADTIAPEARLEPVPPGGEGRADPSSPTLGPAQSVEMSHGAGRDMTARPAASGPVPLVPAPAADLGDARPLAWLEEELALLRVLEVSGSEVRRVPALLGAVCRAIEDGDFHLLHLAGHGAFGGTSTADASAVLLEDGPMRVADLSPRMAASLRREHPLIDFNTCCSGRLGFSLTRLGAWGAQFVQLGCGGFLGTLWPVTDHAAVSFARAFYESFARGLPLGEAVRLARIRVREQYPHDPTWLAYCCYADPMARVEHLAASATVSPG
jgi:RNA polymerase sigma factor (sigma-70 family)